VDVVRALLDCNADIDHAGSSNLRPTALLFPVRTLLWCGCYWSVGQAQPSSTAKDGPRRIFCPVRPRLVLTSRERLLGVGCARSGSPLQVGAGLPM
jgi:hypothetical protein